MGCVGNKRNKHSIYPRLPPPFLLNPIKLIIHVLQHTRPPRLQSMRTLGVNDALFIADWHDPALKCDYVPGFGVALASVQAALSPVVPCQGLISGHTRVTRPETYDYVQDAGGLTRMLHSVVRYIISSALSNLPSRREYVEEKALKSLNYHWSTCETPIPGNTSLGPQFAFHKSGRISKFGCSFQYESIAGDM